MNFLHTVGGEREPKREKNKERNKILLFRYRIQILCQHNEREWEIYREWKTEREINRMNFLDTGCIWLWERIKERHRESEGEKENIERDRESKRGKYIERKKTPNFLDTGYDFYCQYGERECMGNMIQV